MKRKLLYKSLLGYAFIFIMIGASTFLGNKEIILPEIAALAVGGFIYQHPAWLAKPIHIFLLPSITAIGGFLINRMDVSLATKLILTLLFVLSILLLFRSSLAPAFATGLLPIITNADSIYFILAILTLTFLLFISLSITNKGVQLPINNKEQSPKAKILYIIFISIWVLICSSNRWMSIAGIPPVIVVGYESIQKEQYTFSMFCKQGICLFVAAFVGTISLYFFNNLLLAALVDILLISVFLKLLAFKLTPTYAMSILPMVLPPASREYFCLQVLIMSCLVLGFVFLYKNVKFSSRLFNPLVRNKI
jgi:hypothetical protein